MTAITTQTFIDHSGEMTSFGLHTPNLDVSNIDDFTNPLVTFALGNLLIAVNALTLLNRTVTSIGAERQLSSGVLPADENAQREQKLLVKYLDTVTNKKYQFTIPGIDRTLVAQQGTDVVDFESNALMIALVSAVESKYVSELGNPISVYASSLVGRNN